MNSTLKHITLKDLKQRLDHYLLQGEPLAIEQDGTLLGYFVPSKTKSSLEQLDQAVEAFIASAGMTREQLADTLDLSKPFPYEARH